MKRERENLLNRLDVSKKSNILSVRSKGKEMRGDWAMGSETNRCSEFFLKV